jgi:hypothetical protein
MYKRFCSTFCAAMVFGAIPLAGAQPPAADDPLEQFKERLTRAAEANMKDADSRDMTGFRVNASDNAELGIDFKPNGNRFQLLEITSPGVFRTMVEKGRSSGSLGGSTGAYHRNSGERLFAAWDADGDGRLDGLDYSVVDENGKTRLVVIDYEADGQLDLRLHFDEGYNEIWHVDRWYRVEKRGDQRGVILDGEFVELERQGDRPVVPQR